jgi:hypothetical protein
VEEEPHELVGNLFEEREMDKALTWFIRSWLALVLLANVAAIVGFFLLAATAWDGWRQVRETYNPYNISNFVAEMVSLSPALGALYWRDRRRALKNAGVSN